MLRCSKYATDAPQRVLGQRPNVASYARREARKRGIDVIYITWDSAATTLAMLRLLMAATQIRPESTP